MNNILEKIEKKLDKVISNLKNINNKELTKPIDDLEGIKGTIIAFDIVRLSSQVGWNEKKENKYE